MERTADLREWAPFPRTARTVVQGSWSENRSLCQCPACEPLECVYERFCRAGVPKRNAFEIVCLHGTPEHDVVLQASGESFE